MPHELDPVFARKARELIAVARHQYRTRRGGKARRLPAGWKHVGFGYFSVVYKHADYPQYVVKLSGCAGYGDGPQPDPDRPDCWPTFAMHCMVNPHPHLPIVYAVEPVSSTLTFGILEALEPAGKNNADRNELRYIWRRVLNRRQAATGELRWMWPIVRMAANNAFKIDLHEANVMLRPGTNELVMTDPFSWVKTSSSRTYYEYSEEMASDSGLYTG